ncbi:MAG TPA: bifunctional pyr operon transcriptional regulator/uracil phosphoribosyltransferase PyrR [Rubricoccaceae bacterium]
MPRSVLMTPERVRRTLLRLAAEVVERNRGAERLLVFGLRNRGVDVAEALAAAVAEISGEDIEVVGLDVSPFRDDRPGGPPEPLADDAPDATDRDVLLVDDVLFTGRTARAALDAVVQHGRPRTIRLAVLVDRGGREVPVQPDFVGRTVPTNASERVTVDLAALTVYLDT